MGYSYDKMGSYLYSRLPHYHRVVDTQNELLLKRFMEVLNVGFQANDEALKRALETTQASKCGEENLEELAKSLGADWISTIDPSYQRTIVRMLIKLYKQKGTIDTIRFIASELSGFEAKIIEGEIPSEYYEEGDENKRLLTVKLQAPELDDPILAQQHETTISEVIDKFLPVHTKCILVVTYFYSEDYYKRIPYKDSYHVKQDTGEGYKVFRDDYIIKEKLKYLYDTESNFKMIGHPDVLGLTNNPLYLLNSTMHTTKTRYDILHHTGMVIKTDYTKTFEGVGTIINKLYQDWDVVASPITSTLVNDNYKLNMEYVSVFNLPQLNREDYVLTHSLSQDTGEYTSSPTSTTEESREVTKLSELNEQEAILDIKYDKVERVMVQSILEDEPITDLGIHKYVMRTSILNCKLSTKEGRLTVPSYIDKVYQEGTLTYIYE